CGLVALVATLALAWLAPSMRAKGERAADPGPAGKEDGLTLQALQARLAKKITLDKGFDNLPFKDAVDFLTEHFELPILVDTEAFKQEYDVDVGQVQVTLPKLGRMPLAALLRLLLAKVPPQGATFLVRPDYVEITTVGRMLREVYGSVATDTEE